MIALERECGADNRDLCRRRKASARSLCRKRRRLRLAELHRAVAAEQHLLLADDNRLEQILRADRTEIVKAFTLQNRFVRHEVFEAERLIERKRILRLNRDHAAALPLRNTHRNAVDIDARDCFPMRSIAAAALHARRGVAQRREHRIHEARGRLQVIVLESVPGRETVRLFERRRERAVQSGVHACQCLFCRLIHAHVIFLHHNH